MSGLYASFVLTTRLMSVLAVFALRKEGDRIEPEALFGGDFRRIESKGSGELVRPMLSVDNKLE